MLPILSGSDRVPSLKAGVQPAVATSEADSHTAVELELMSVLEGPAFRTTPRSRAFLRFVVEETLAGRAGSLKERTIGVAVLGRDHAYDTGADAVVRVRANDVRKRLAAHYEQALPKAGRRIELPLGCYVPRFAEEPLPAISTQSVSLLPVVAPMRLWQLALPTIFALFLALLSIRSDADTSDSFIRFWSRMLAGRSEIIVEVDAAGDKSSISPAMAEAAMPLALVGISFQMPVHLSVATHRAIDPRVCVIRLSSAGRPPTGAIEWTLGGVHVFRSVSGGPALWLVGQNAEEIGLAVRRLCARSAFPDLRPS